MTWKGDDMMLTIFSFIFGAFIGSFLNVCIYRIPKGESVISPRSYCPRCLKPIRWFDNIPLISYFMLRGRCRYCGDKISYWYPAVECGTALSSLLLFLKYGPSFRYLVYFLFVSALIVVTAIDLRHRIIPDVISLPGTLVGVLASWLLPHVSLKDSIFGVLLGGGSLFVVATAYQWFFRREGMGGGDVKLLAMIGAFLGWKLVILTIVLSSLLGSIIGIIIMVAKGRDLKYAIPFGPFLSGGAILSLFYGSDLIRWYIQVCR